MVALTLCLSILTVCIRMLREEPSKPALTSHHTAVTAGSIALFGVLITGVYLITAFSIDQRAAGVEQRVEDTVAMLVRSSIENEVSPALAEFRDEMVRSKDDAITAILGQAQVLETRTLGEWIAISSTDYRIPQLAGSSGFVFVEPGIVSGTRTISIRVGDEPESMYIVARLIVSNSQQRGAQNMMVPISTGKWWSVSNTDNSAVHWIPMFSARP